MSLVSDALKKAEQMRLERAGVLGPRQQPVVRARPLHAGHFGPTSAKWWWMNVAVLAVALIMAVVYLRRPVTNTEQPAAAAVAASTVAGSPTGAAGPVMTAPAEAEVAESAPEPTVNATPEPAYQLCGVTVAGKDVLVGVTRKDDGRSAWISVGQTLGDVTVVSYDAKREQAVLRVDGQLVTAGMRSGSW